MILLLQLQIHVSNEIQYLELQNSVPSWFIVLNMCVLSPGNFKR